MLAITNEICQEELGPSFKTAYWRHIHRNGFTGQKTWGMPVSNKARTLQIAERRNSEAVKPEPPQDLWAQLDKISAEVNMRALIEKGPDMFCAADYSRRYGIGVGSASDRLNKLRRLGKIEFVGLGINNAKFYRIKKS